MLLTLQDMLCVVRFDMSNCTGLVTAQRRNMGPVCLFVSVVSMGAQSVCGQVNVGLLQ